MCRAVTCKTSGKTTWSGCGQHVASVRQGVAASQWCDGQHTQAELAGTRSGSSFLARLFGR